MNDIFKHYYYSKEDYSIESFIRFNFQSIDFLERAQADTTERSIEFSIAIFEIKKRMFVELIKELTSQFVGKENF